MTKCTRILALFSYIFQLIYLPLNGVNSHGCFEPCGSGDDFINPRSSILFYHMSFDGSGEEGKLMKSLHADGQKN